MFVRLFVDENLDRIIPISKQPKEKIQAIIDSCARQFPEFSDRSRKRIRTYLKSCRRNKKMRDGWDNTVSIYKSYMYKFYHNYILLQNRPTPAHLTSVQAEQILAIACENESMNAKRMRIGLEPITHAIPAPGSAVAAAAAAAAAAVAAGATSSAASTASCGSNSATITSMPLNDGTAVTSSTTTLPFVSGSGFTRSTPNSETSETMTLTPAAAVAAAVSSLGGGSINSARSSPLALSSNASTAGMDIKPLAGCLSNGNSGATNGSNNNLGVLTGLPASSPLYNPSNLNAASAAASPFVAAAAAAVAAGRTPTYPGYFPGLGNGECRNL